MVNKLFKSIIFLIVNCFSIAFILGLLAFFMTPTGKKVGSAVATEAKTSVAKLPKKVRHIFAKKTYKEKAQAFVKSGAESTAQGVADAVHVVAYYLGYLALLAVVVFCLFKLV